MAPKSKTTEEWKNQIKWLKVVDGKLLCTICISQKSVPDNAPIKSGMNKIQETVKALSG